MEVQIPLYLERYLEELGVLRDPRLSQQEESYEVYEIDMGYKQFDEYGEPPF